MLFPLFLFEPEHPWLKVDGEASDRPIDSAVQNRLKQFRAMNKMTKLAMKVCFMPNIPLNIFGNIELGW